MNILNVGIKMPLTGFVLWRGLPVLILLCFVWFELLRLSQHMIFSGLKCVDI